jgi:hypothetical protein
MFTRFSKRSVTSSTTTTILISQLAKQLEEEREARKKLQEELESIKQMSHSLLSSKKALAAPVAATNGETTS